jgi:hypothetical protein
MDDGHVVVESITPIRMADITQDLARESGFDNVDNLLRIAKHGPGDKVFLIRFHYLPPGGWDTPVAGIAAGSRRYKQCRGGGNQRMLLCKLDR